MKYLWWVVALFTLAVAFAVLGRLNNGYVLLIAPPYRVEFSLNFMITSLLLSFLIAYGVVRLVGRTLHLPQKVREFRVVRSAEKIRHALDSALVALLEGRYGKARQQAEKALRQGDRSGLAAMVGARAALEVRAFDQADNYLTRAEEGGQSLLVSRLMTQAEMALTQQQPLVALETLARLKREAGLHTAALRLEWKALQAAERWDEVPALVEQLQKREVFEPEQARQLRWHAQGEHLRALAHDELALRSYWKKLSSADQLHPKVSTAAAKSFLQLGAYQEAADIVAASLEHEWVPELLPLFSECAGDNPTRQLERAENWLAKHSQDAVLLLVLGKLCSKAQLWGKAQTYLEASLAIENSYSAHLSLGEMLGKLGRSSEANAHLAAALRLALAQLEVR